MNVFIAIDKKLTDQNIINQRLGEMFNHYPLVTKVTPEMSKERVKALFVPDTAVYATGEQLLKLSRGQEIKSEKTGEVLAYDGPEHLSEFSIRPGILIISDRIKSGKLTKAKDLETTEVNKLTFEHVSRRPLFLSSIIIKMDVDGVKVIRDKTKPKEAAK